MKSRPAACKAPLQPLFVSLYVYLSVCTSICPIVGLCVCLCICLRVSVCVSLSVGVSIGVCVGLYVRVYLCVLNLTSGTKMAPMSADHGDQSELRNLFIVVPIGKDQTLSIEGSAST